MAVRWGAPVALLAAAQALGVSGCRRVERMEEEPYTEGHGTLRPSLATLLRVNPPPGRVMTPGTSTPRMQGQYSVDQARLWGIEEEGVVTETPDGWLAHAVTYFSPVWGPGPAARPARIVLMRGRFRNFRSVDWEEHRVLEVGQLANLMYWGEK